MRCCTQTVLTTLIFFSHIDIFKAVREGHINRSKIGHALISAIVTAFVYHISIFCSFRCSSFSFLFLFFYFLCQDKTNMQIHTQTKGRVNLIYFVNAKVIREHIHTEPSYFCIFDALNDIINSCSKY